MAKLTDLPDEILTMIFRNFLSSTLTDHSILCDWKRQWAVDNDEKKTRANLARLALVSKALHALAMPLLFEQLFHYQDTHRLVETKESLRAAVLYARYILYLDVHIEVKGGDLHPRIKRLLSHCTRLKHLKATPWTPYKDTGRAYSSVFDVARKCRIQSLYVEMSNDTGGPPVVLDQLLIIDSLVGLQIQLANAVREDHSQKMRNLKILKIDSAGEPEADALCASLACSNTLVEATIELAPQPLSSQFFDLENWHGLETLRIRMHGDVDLHSQVAMSRVPSLRTLAISPEENDAISYSAILPGLPASVTMLVLRCVIFPELRMILEALLRRDVLLGLRHLVLDLESMADEYIYVDTSEEAEEVLELAETALGVLKERGVIYHPVDIAEILKDSFLVRDAGEDAGEASSEDAEEDIAGDALEDVVENVPMP